MSEDSGEWNGLGPIRDLKEQQTIATTAQAKNAGAREAGCCERTQSESGYSKGRMQMDFLFMDS